MIHPTAIIDQKARLDENVRVGPYTIISAEVEIGSDTEIASHVVINGPARLGKENRIFQFSSIGEIPQDKKYKGERSSLEVGDRNVIREYVTFNRGTADGTGKTIIASVPVIVAGAYRPPDCAGSLSEYCQVPPCGLR